MTQMREWSPASRREPSLSITRLAVELGRGQAERAVQPYNGLNPLQIRFLQHRQHPVPKPPATPPKQGRGSSQDFNNHDPQRQSGR